MKWQRVKRAETVAARVAKEMMHGLDGTDWSKKWGDAHEALQAIEGFLADNIAAVLLRQSEFRS